MASKLLWNMLEMGVSREMTDIVEQLCTAAEEIKKLRAELAEYKRAEYLKSKYRTRRYRLYLRLKKEFEKND